MNRSSSPLHSTPLRRTRLLLGGLGIALVVLGAVLFIQQIPAIRYPGVAGWLLGALVVHDGIIAAAVLGVGLLLRLAPWSAATKAIVSGAAVVGGIMALIVLPAAWKDAIGTANPTVLPFDYLGNLVWFELGVVLVAVVAVIAARNVTARRSATRRRSARTTCPGPAQRPPRRPARCRRRAASAASPPSDLRCAVDQADDPRCRRPTW
ncbi:hypothetical protein ABMA10_08860 [Plantibacter sp. RU18]